MTALQTVRRRTSSPPGYEDPGPTPAELYQVPGFVHDVAEHFLATCPSRNQAAGFAAALALQAALAARKVREASNCRTTLCVLLLGQPASGKSSALGLNQEILERAGLDDLMGPAEFASPQAVESWYHKRPAMLIQQDYFESELRWLHRWGSRRSQTLHSLVELMKGADGSRLLPTRTRDQRPRRIDQPCPILLAACSHDGFFESLANPLAWSHEFFQLAHVVECSQAVKGQRAANAEPPASIVEAARWWGEFRPCAADEADWRPATVEADAEAEHAFETLCDAQAAEMWEAHHNGDEVRRTAWCRATEKARSLALIYAVSEDRRRPRIHAEAARWATRFVQHQTRRMLHLCRECVS